MVLIESNVDRNHNLLIVYSTVNISDPNKRQPHYIIRLLVSCYEGKFLPTNERGLVSNGVKVA